MNTLIARARPATLDEVPSVAPVEGTGPVVGCRTTRIYCRAVCRPGHAPRPENCIAFLNAAIARAEGFRPCKQCRPDALARVDSGSSLAVPGAGTFRYGFGLTPVGAAFVALSARGICAISLLDVEDASPGLLRLGAEHPGAVTVEDQAAVAPILKRLEGFVLDGHDCNDLTLDLSGRTPFHQRVWRAVQAIPRGETRTYGEVASGLSHPGAARAVGTACAANPVALLIPCHRVVRAGGALGGYDWGLDRKRALLEWERGN